MSQLSKNIYRHEIACKCGCGFDTMDVETVEAVQECCDNFARVLGVDRVILDITSGARCLTYNRKPVSQGGPGSTDKSQHPKARAIDFRIRGVSPHDVYEYLNAKYPEKYGIGKYNTFTHLDTRQVPARW
ncbi:D-Ala-D-Ala carboxypeptidase family metallohydrolase [Marinobacterium litorale]|uniref:D-Ala-D-Ala carboxypeptidase family metallohydrolase n=1 Tax=Marinobacterium litorale TaxID=404770 RepID=UPI0004822CFE|nr:D-Ala-D-Ala carboxypeptidase family metallohydrolase [Marinobacterium litorale]